MKRTYSVAEARDRLPALIREAETVGYVRITRRGKGAAVILAERDFDRLTKGSAGLWSALTTFRKSVGPKDLKGVRGLLDGLRDASPGRDVKP